MADRIAVLDLGKLQQLDTPKALYEQPTSAFVAGFIGETNFWPAVSSGDAAAGSEVGVTLEGGEQASVTAADAIRTGQKVKVAIRPENIRLSGDRAGLQATVEEAIYAGSVTTLLLRSKGPTLRVRVGPDGSIGEPAPGTPLRIGLADAPRPRLRRMTARPSRFMLGAGPTVLPQACCSRRRSCWF